MPEAKGPAYVQGPASGKVGTLTLQYRDGVPVLAVAGGNGLPTGLAVLDEAGNAVGLYTVRPVKAAVSSRKALTAAQQYVTAKGLPVHTPVARILEGGENEVFSDLFD
ncbi:hypothetical protein ACFVUB_39655 [Streptomyces niveus]|uniref:hypothetical protein n=1 Tax=Streptomyces niveus TaxID=193462 RepID=UPI0036DD5904